MSSHTVVLESDFWGRISIQIDPATKEAELTAYKVEGGTTFREQMAFGKGLLNMAQQFCRDMGLTVVANFPEREMRNLCNGSEWESIAADVR